MFHFDRPDTDPVRPLASPRSTPLVPTGRGIVFLLLCLAWALPGLVGHDPWKPDEAYGFGLVYHILKSGDWIVPTLAGEPFMEKPPLYYLTAALFARFLPWLPAHDAARTASGFYSLVALLFTGFAARELWGGGRFAVAAMLALMGCLGLTVPAHQLITDIALLAGFAVGIHGLALARRRPILAGLFLGTGTGIGFLSKGLIAPGVIGVAALALPIGFRPWRTRAYALSLPVAFLAALPWLVIWPYRLYVHSPALFMDWFWENNLGRFFGFVRLGPKADTANYLKILPWFALPAWPLALRALWRARSTALQDPAIQLNVTLFLVMFAVLSVAADAREVYALPMLLPLALLAAPAVTDLPAGFERFGNAATVAIFGSLGALLWTGWLVLMTGQPAAEFNRLTASLPGYTPSFDGAIFAIAAALTLLWFAAVVALRRAPQRLVANWTVGLVLLWGLASTLWLPALDAGKSYRSMMLSLRDALPRRYQCVASAGLGEPQRAMLDYFAGVRTLRREIMPGADCDLMLVQGEAFQAAEPSWRLLWEGSRPGDAGERFRLYRRIPNSGTALNRQRP